MSSDFRRMLEDRLNEFRVWSHERQFQGCRLVSYSGAECVGAISVPLGEIEREIEGALSEGFGVKWAEYEGHLYLCIWESLPKAPSWSHIFAEEDVSELFNPMRNLADAVLDYL